MDTAYYRISEIKLSPDDEKSRIPEKICRKLGLEESDIIEWKIVKESIDARKKPDIRLVYTVDFLCDKKDILKRKGAKISLAPDESYEMPVCRRTGMKACLTPAQTYSSERAAQGLFRTASSPPA